MTEAAPCPALQELPGGRGVRISALGGTRAAPAILSGPAGTFGSDPVVAHELPSRLPQGKACAGLSSRTAALGR